MSDRSTWNSLEIAKLIAAFAQAFALALFGYFVTEHQRELDEKNTQHSEGVKNRVEIWKDVGPRLNRMYVYTMYVGKWNELSYKKLFADRRDANETMYTNRLFFSKKCFDAYEKYMSTVWDSDRNRPARINTTAARRIDADKDFTDENVTGKDVRKAIADAYRDLQQAMGEDLALVVEIPNAVPDAQEYVLPRN
jgi:hypothetical protein